MKFFAAAFVCLLLISSTCDAALHRRSVTVKVGGRRVSQHRVVVRRAPVVSRVRVSAGFLGSRLGATTGGCANGNCNR